MTYKSATATLALAGLITSASPTFAMTGIGCPDLPSHARAIGTIEMGEGACGMTMDEARRILAQDNPQVAAPAAPQPRTHRKHHRRQPPPM